MTPIWLGLVLALLEADAPARGHDANSVYQSVRTAGLKVGETKVALPEPSLGEGASAEVEREALRRLAGSERGADELTRDSVTAPFILKTRDEPVEGRGLVRVADLWFVVHARFDDIDPEQVAGSTDAGRPVEAANMKFQVKRIGPQELARRGIKPTRDHDAREWYAHLSGRLLDRIQVEATDRTVATKGDGSWLIASEPVPGWRDEDGHPDRWYPITRRGALEEEGDAQPYSGGISYVKASRLESAPGGLLVEAHCAFFEPKAWFDGAPILRSKIGLVAQDRIRALRRELAKSRPRREPRVPSGPQGR